MLFDNLADTIDKTLNKKNGGSMKRLVVLLFVILLEVIFVVGCGKQEAITKTVVIEKGQLVKEVLHLLVPEAPLSIDHGEIKKKALPRGVIFQGGSIVGVPKENGELTITLTWNQKGERYETNVSFEQKL